MDPNSKGERLKFFIRKGVFVFDEKDQLIAIAGSWVYETFW